MRFCPVQLRAPRRLNNQDSFKVYALYAQEIDPPEGEQAVCWMLLTTETVTNAAQAATMLCAGTLTDGMLKSITKSSNQAVLLKVIG